MLEHGLSGLALLDINHDQASKGVEALRVDFPAAILDSFAINVTDPDSVDAAISAAQEALGSINILCCFAGVVGCNHAAEMSAAEWRNTLDINATGTFLCAQAVAK